MSHKLLVLLVVLGFATPDVARAAFVSCEDARTYGENSARLFVGQTFARVACDPGLLSRAQLGLDRVLSRQVLRTYDSDEEKLCFYDGMYYGLREQLILEYAACEGEPSFACLPGETLSSHLGSLVSALSLSALDPRAVGLEGVLATFARPATTALVCACVDEMACEQALLASMSPYARALFDAASPQLAALSCEL